MTGEGSRWRLYLLVVAVYLLWGGNFVASKVALAEMPGLVAASLRTLIAAALLVAAYLWTRRSSRQAIERSELPWLALLGAIGIAVNQATFLLGLARTSAGHAALMIGLTPLIVLLLAVASRHERLTWRKLAGLIVAIAGAALLQRGDGHTGPSLAGDLLMLAAAASFAFYTVFGKQAIRTHGSLGILAVSYAAGALCLLPVAWNELRDFHPTQVSSAAWIAFLYMTVISSVVCYLFFYYALSRLAASRVSAFAYLQPLAATLLALPLLGEPITSTIVGGGSLVLAGVFLAERG